MAISSHIIFWRHKLRILFRNDHLSMVTISLRNIWELIQKHNLILDFYSWSRGNNLSEVFLNPSKNLQKASLSEEQNLYKGSVRCSLSRLANTASFWERAGSIYHTNANCSQFQNKTQTTQWKTRISFGAGSLSTIILEVALKYIPKDVYPTL